MRTAATRRCASARLAPRSLGDVRRLVVKEHRNAGFQRPRPTIALAPSRVNWYDYQCGLSDS